MTKLRQFTVRHIAIKVLFAVGCGEDTESESARKVDSGEEISLTAHAGNRTRDRPITGPYAQRTELSRPLHAQEHNAASQRPGDRVKLE